MYEKEIEMPLNVQAEVAGKRVSVSGPKGKLEYEFKGLFGVKIEKSEKGVKAFSESEERKQKAIVGSIIAHVRNMVDGVTKGYTAKLKVIYSHFPVTVKVDEKERKVLVNNFLGEKIPRVAKIVGKDTKVDAKGADVTVSGTDIEAIGQTAANMEQVTKIREHDRKVFQDGIFITEKPRGKM